MAEAAGDATGGAEARSGRTDIRATPATPGEPGLRAAYLDLLKLCLCDLAGAGTSSVKGLPGGQLASWELDADDLQARANGRDWPLHGLTMTGLARLGDLERCVETVVDDAVAGDLIEAGSWRGGSSLLMRATLDSLGAGDRTVWVADSFQGFPAPEAADKSVGFAGSVAPYLAAFDYLAAPLNEVRDSFARLGYVEGVRFVPGFFEQTLPNLAGGEHRWAVVRLDCDTYDVTLLALRCLYPNLSPGGYLIIDDYQDIDECRQAVDDFRREHAIDEPLEAVDWSCARWRRTAESPIEPFQAPASDATPPRRPMKRPERWAVPTERQLELEHELTELQASLDAVRAQLTQAGAYEALLREVTQSTSWRLTRPLRALSGRMRRRSP